MEDQGGKFMQASDTGISADSVHKAYLRFMKKMNSWFSSTGQQCIAGLPRKRLKIAHRARDRLPPRAKLRR